MSSQTDTPSTRRVKVIKKRVAYPHHALLGAAYHNLCVAEEGAPGSYYAEMACILFSGLALEALANAFGARYVEKWDDFESARPIAKIRIVAEKMGIEVVETKKPWSLLRELIPIRNELAHAKPMIADTELEMSDTEWRAKRKEYPLSRLEKKITLKNAKRFFEAVDAIWILFCEKIPEDDIDHHLRADGWSGSSSTVR